MRRFIVPILIAPLISGCATVDNLGPKITRNTSSSDEQIQLLESGLTRNRQLAERIQAGLSLAVADGSFDRLFFSIPGFSQGYQEMNNKNRLVFQLESPHQSPQENP